MKTRAFAVPDQETPPTVLDVELPDPGPGQALVRIEAASLNGFDAAVAAGYVWAMMAHEFPVILGRDFAGVVEGVGDGVSTFQPGDRVAGVYTRPDLLVGSIAGANVYGVDLLARVPDGVSSVLAAAVGLAGVAAVDLIDAVSLSADDVVLISGSTGGVGAFAVQLAAARGASVLATVSGDDDAEFLRGLGATYAADYTGDLSSAVRAVAPDGVTAIVHTAGDPATLAGLLRPGGRLASSLGATGEAIARDDVTVTSVAAEASPAKVESLLRAVADGQLTVPVSRTFPLEAAADALASWGQHKRGKIVITTD